MPDYRLAARRAALRHGIDPHYFLRQIGAESGFNPNAGSSAGARGIAQFMPATAAGMGVNLNDGRVTDDLNGAAKLMAGYLHKYGNWRDALTAYNAGPGRVGKPLYGETQAYIARILGNKNPRAGVGSTAPNAAPKAPAAPRQTTTTQTLPGVDNSALRAQAVATFIGRRNQDPLDFALNMRSLKDVPGEQVTTKTAAAPRTAGAPQAASGGAAGSAVAFAQSRVGQYQESTGSNRGPQLDSLEKRFGMSGQPWCAMFTSVAVTRGGAPKVARTASVAEVRRQVGQGGAGYQRGFVKRARPGDLILFGNNHIAFVESVGSDGRIRAISGNGATGRVARVTYAAGSGDIARPLYTKQM